MSSESDTIQWCATKWLSHCKYDMDLKRQHINQTCNKNIRSCNEPITIVTFHVLLFNQRLNTFLNIAGLRLESIRSKEVVNMSDRTYRSDRKTQPDFQLINNFKATVVDASCADVLSWYAQRRHPSYQPQKGVQNVKWQTIRMGCTCDCVVERLRG